MDRPNLIREAFLKYGGTVVIHKTLAIVTAAALAILALAMIIPTTVFDVVAQDRFITYNNPDYGVRLLYPANRTAQETDLEPKQVVFE